MGDYHFIEIMAKLHAEERMRQVEQLRREYGPGTLQGGWFAGQCRQVAGHAGRVLMAIGQRLEEYARLQTEISNPQG